MADLDRGQGVDLGNGGGLRRWLLQGRYRLLRDGVEDSRLQTLWARPIGRETCVSVGYS
ncbi:hypothetical protein [Salipiger mucosus]|uniref:Uncharacterized protein n=1 Tax=Salipiger mucosus DSM 16094 TaxID=1123237 RepID=S9QFD5_9RHOB|nr:hypothetical protein [Salipiger mucosus]EPX78323.1 hypothetical protein Salmuc_03939 [Salipiger mucosus DSM 16094]